MSITGRIDVDVLFHDKEPTRLKVASLRDSRAYAGGKVAVVTGTAGAAGVTLYNWGGYRNASGAVVSFTTVERIAFSWTGSRLRSLVDDADGQFFLKSRDGSVAVTDVDNSSSAVSIAPAISVGSEGFTGTYTLVVYGT